MNYKIGDYVQVIKCLTPIYSIEPRIGSVRSINGRYLFISMRAGGEYIAIEEELERITSDEFFLACI